MASIEKRSWIPLAGTLFVALILLATGTRTQELAGRRIGLVQDWSMHHAVFARVGPGQTMMALGRDPRAFQAWQSAMLAATRGSRIEVGGGFEPFSPRPFPPEPRPVRRTEPDWSINLGAAGTANSMYPAKFSFDINATPDCINDYVVYPVNQAPSSGHENLVAFNQLYSGTVPTVGICNRTSTASDTGTAAEVMWSYAIESSESGAVTTSPVLSMDGTRVAFVTSTSGSEPHFHVLAWKSGDGVNGSNLQDPQTDAVVISSFVTTAPVAGTGTATDLAFGASGDTLSSPFIDYSLDRAYVGDDTGHLVRIKDVFCTVDAACSGATPPAPSIDSTWGTGGSVNVPCGATLTGPVEDSTTGNVFVGCSDGKVYGFNSSGTPLTIASITVGNGTSLGGVVDPPIVDGVNGFVYAASGSNGTHPVIAQAKTDLSALVKVSAALGRVTASLHAPTFNDAYFSNATSTTWFIIVTAYNGGGTQTKFYWIGFNASRGMNTTTTGTLLIRSASVECSPPTDFVDGASERLFVGLAGGVDTLFDYHVTGNAPANPPAGSVPEAGGTSGIIVDNVSTSNQASSIYVSTLGSQACGAGPTGNLTGRCAVKLTQAALR